jgi:dual-specificity kinase
MLYSKTGGAKRRNEYADSSTRTTRKPLEPAVDDQDLQRKRRRNSIEPNELSKKQRRGHSDDHSIDTKYPQWHDEDGHFNYRLGESLGDQLDSNNPERRRYKLIDKLGKGTFGLVLLAWDRVENCYVAVKIVRAIKKYTESAMTEIDILTKIQRAGLEELEESLEQISFSGDNAGNQLDNDTKKLKKHIPKHCCITLESWFQYKEHICMVFQKYGLSLYDYLKQNNFKGMDYAMTKDIAYNLFASLYYLHERLQLIHTDLKPENILFVDDGKNIGANLTGNMSPEVRAVRRLSSSEIKIIDLGSATFEHEYHSTIISTRHYRAPEVILQVGWSFPSDVWSVGCILLELYTGRTCFQTHQNSEHLAMMEALLGSFPSLWIDNSSKIPSLNPSSTSYRNQKVADYFEPRERDAKGWILKWYQDAPPESRKRVRAVRKLTDIVALEHGEFSDLISRTLTFDPSRRITASEALDHPYFDSVREKYRTTQSISRSVSEAKPILPKKASTNPLANSLPEQQNELTGSQFMSKSRANSLSLSAKIGRDLNDLTLASLNESF